MIRKCRKAYYNLSVWKKRHNDMEQLYNAQRRRAARLEALLANGGVAPAGDTSLTTEDLAQDGSMLCAAPSPRHRRHAKAALEAHGVTVASKVTMKMATAQACLTAAVKGQKRSTRVELYKEAGQSAKKGRLATSLSKSLQIDRRTLLHPRNLTARQLAAQEKAEKVAAFLVRDNNSSEMPGKKDQKGVGDNYVAKRTLCETMDNLHQKYKKEYPFPPVSLSVFKRARPEHVLLLQDTKHNMCLCERHENFRLLMAAVPTVRKFSVNEWPLITSEEEARAALEEHLGDILEVRYERWEKGDVDRHGKGNNSTQNRLQLLNKSLPRADFINMFVQEMAPFTEHVQRARVQYQAVRTLRESLQPGEVTCQMDFAENWNTDQLNQVQSAYFDHDSVTIHPCVVHIPGQESAASYAFIAADKSHNANMVYAVVKALISDLKVKLPRLRRVHFITDSPTSQYRNTTMFHLVATAKKLLGVEVSWTYFEAGHGKGPCDGVGGAVKRIADQEVNKGSLIQNAWDLYKVMRLLPSKIQYMYVTTNTIKEETAKIQQLPMKTVKGTMKIHGVVGLPGDGKYATRETSCFQECCYKGGEFVLGCPGWERRVV